jgi:plasmid stability protein
VPDDVAERLRRRALASGRTLEAEVRVVLGDATSDADDARQRPERSASVRAAQAALMSLRDPSRSIVDELLAERRGEARRDDDASRTTSSDRCRPSTCLR